jgi:uncharacterized protein (DUF362 family)
VSGEAALGADHFNMAKGKRVTRRELLADAARVAAAASLGSLAACFPDVGGKWPYIGPECVDDTPLPVQGASRVVEVYREDSVVDAPDSLGRIKPTIQADKVQLMVDAALSALAGGADGGTDNPWPTLLPDYKPGQRIGLKVNCLNSTVPTSAALILAIVKNLTQKLGVNPNDIIVWDRRLDELTRNPGYTRTGLGGAQMMGTVTSTEDASGPGYSETFCGVIANKPPRLSRILTEMTDLTINCPVLKTHDVSGVTGALKNIYGIIHNPGDYHNDVIADALPALYRLPPIRRGIKLTIIDALIAVTWGGTDAQADTVPKRILVSSDPLAIDSYALALVNKLRAAARGARTSADADANAAPDAATGTDSDAAGFWDVKADRLGWMDNAYKLGIGTKAYNLIAITQT